MCEPTNFPGKVFNFQTFFFYKKTYCILGNTIVEQKSKTISYKNVHEIKNAYYFNIELIKLD